MRCAFRLRPSHGAACSRRSQGQGKAGPRTNCVGARVGYVRDMTPGYRVAPRLRRARACARRVHQGHGGVHQHRAGQQPQPAHPPGDHHYVRHVRRGHVLPGRGRAPALTLPPPNPHRRGHSRAARLLARSRSRAKPARSPVGDRARLRSKASGALCCSSVHTRGLGGPVRTCAQALCGLRSRRRPGGRARRRTGTESWKARVSRNSARQGERGEKREREREREREWKNERETDKKRRGAAGAGILGENLVLPRRLMHNAHSFWVVNAVTFGLCLVCFMGLMAYIRWRRLM